jgi:YbbR domain-containing protein
MRSSNRIPNPFVFLWQNRDTVVLAILLSVAVWVSAVYANDPNREDFIDPQVTLDVTPYDDSLVLISDLPQTVRVRLRAPESVWQALAEDPDLLQARLDLSEVEAGEQTVPIQVDLQLSPAQVLEVSPSQVKVTLDRYVERTDLPVSLVELGEIASGFQKDSSELLLDDVEVVVSGPAERMDQVTQVLGNLTLQDARQSFNTTVGLFPADEEGEMVSGVDVSPKVAEVAVKISQAGQYRDVPVVVLTRGEPASGYQRTSTDVDPLIVTLYAEDEAAIAAIPGYVNTKPVLLTGKTDSFVIQVGLDLPEGVIMAGDTTTQTVAVSIGISPKVVNVSFSVPISIRDLASGLKAELSPASVEVFLTGPEPVVNTLLTTDVIVFVNLAGYEPGTYFGELNWDVLLEQVEVLSINPDRIEVIITEIDGQDLTLTQTLTPTVTPTPTSTPTPSP